MKSRKEGRKPKQEGSIRRKEGRKEGRKERSQERKEGR